MPLALPYARISSEKQTAGEGIARQLKAAQDWIAAHPEHDLTLDLPLTDIARSAWKGDHVNDEDGALGTLIRLVKAGTIPRGRWLIVEALDRLSRENPWKAHNQLSGLVLAGITVVTTKDNKVYSEKTDMGAMIMSVALMAAANQESEDKSNRVKFTKAARVADAMANKYVLSSNTPAWLRVADTVSSSNRTTRKYELIDRHGATIQAMYQMALHHGAGYITSWLIFNQVEAFGTSGKWNIKYVKNILEGRAVLGHLQTKHGLIEDTFPRVIDDDLWLRVQAVRQGRVNVGGHRMGTWVNLFAGLTRCATCEGRMRVNAHGHTGRTSFRYYECENRSVLKNCANKCRYRADILENAVLGYLDWISVSAAEPMPPADLPALMAEVEKLTAREKRLAGKLAELDDDDMYGLLMEQLRPLREAKNIATSRLAAAQQATAVAAAPVVIRDLTDRSALHTALQQWIKGVWFGEGHEVMVKSAGGLLMATARHNGPDPYMMLAGPDGQVAILEKGKPLRFTDAPEGMPALDARTIADVRRQLRLSQVQ